MPVSADWYRALTELAYPAIKRADGNGIFDVPIAVAANVDSSVRFRWLAPGAGWQTSPAVSPVAFPTP